MTRRLNQIKRRLLKEDTSYSFEAKKTYFSNVAIETKSFLEKAFRGAVNVRLSLKREAQTKFCIEGYAFIIKVILDSIHGECVADVNIYCGDNGLTIDVSRTVGEFTEEEISDIESVAKASEIGIKTSAQSVSLVCPALELKNLTLGKHIPSCKIIAAFNYVFFEPLEGDETAVYD